MNPLGCWLCFLRQPYISIACIHVAREALSGHGLDGSGNILQVRIEKKLKMYFHLFGSKFPFSIPPCLPPFTEVVYNPITNFLLAGWSAVPEEKASRYRLSIKDVQMQDSGTYTCASPRGLTNSIIIVVAGISCLD